MHTTQPSLLLRLRVPGEQEAWKRFVDLYTPLLFFWARRARMSSEDAADLVQEVFTVLLEKMPAFEYDRNKSFRGWLRMVTMNKWRDKCRRRTPMVVEDADMNQVPTENELEQQWETEYQQQLLARALEIMKADFAPVTWKACWEFIVVGRPAVEIAAELGLTENAVYLAKGRVLRRLRQELAGMLD